MPFFPEIGKDEFIFAGGGDHELVYEQGQPVGYADLVEGSIGFTVGVQSMRGVRASERKRPSL